ncbi:MAG: CoA-transferase [Frisingicoccus sp.]
MVVGVGDSFGFGTPEELLIAIEKRYTETGQPMNLTAFHSPGIGDSKTKGMNHFAHEGLLKRLICGHVGLAPKLGQLCADNKVECFIIPQGVCSHLLRAAGGRKPGLITHVGLKTYADPRIEACKGNQAAKDSGYEVVELVNLDGKTIYFINLFRWILFPSGNLC